MGATLQALIDRVQNNYDETGTTNTSEAEIQQWIQEAMVRLADTGYLIAEMTTSLADGQLKYDISGWIGDRRRPPDMGVAECGDPLRCGHALVQVQADSVGQATSAD